MYTARFEDAIKKLTEWTSKEKKLDVTVKEFEVSITINPHMNVCIQYTLCAYYIHIHSSCKKQETLKHTQQYCGEQKLP